METAKLLGAIGHGCHRKGTCGLGEGKRGTAGGSSRERQSRPRFAVVGHPHAITRCRVAVFRNTST